VIGRLAVYPHSTTPGGGGGGGAGIQKKERHWRRSRQRACRKGRALIGRDPVRFRFAARFPPEGSQGRVFAASFQVPDDCRGKNVALTAFLDIWPTVSGKRSGPGRAPCRLPQYCQQRGPSSHGRPLRVALVIICHPLGQHNSTRHDSLPLAPGG